MKYLIAFLFILPPIAASSSSSNSSNSSGNTPLHDAAKQHDSDTVEFLVLNNADITALNNSGVTPLDMARDCCYFTSEEDDNYSNNMDIYLFLFQNQLHGFKTNFNTSALNSISCEDDCCEDCEYCEEDGK